MVVNHQHVKFLNDNVKALGKRLTQSDISFGEMDVNTCCSMSICILLFNVCCAGATFGWQCVCDGVWDSNQWTFCQLVEAN